jgi:ferredoxin
MLHAINSKEHGPFGEPMVHAIQACVHCGFCLAACPTYHELGQEMDTPRGRIVLMKQVLEGTLSATARSRISIAALAAWRANPRVRAACLIAISISPYRAQVQKNFRAPAAKTATLAGCANDPVSPPFPARTQRRENRPGAGTTGAGGGSSDAGVGAARSATRRHIA